MKKAILIALVATFTMVAVTPALAEGGNSATSTKAKIEKVEKFRNRAVNISGELMSISGTSTPATIVIKIGKVVPKKNKKWVGAYPEVEKNITVNISDKTRLVREYWGKSSLEEFSLNDKLSVVGKTNEDGTINANVVKNNSIHYTFRVHNGVVESVSTTGSYFMMKQANKLVKVITDAKTKFFLAGIENPTLADLSVGDRVHVRGVINKKTKQILASLVRENKWRFPIISATSTASTTNQ